MQLSYKIDEMKLSRGGYTSMENEFAKVIRPEPLEDAILRLAKKYELCSRDKENEEKEVFNREAKSTYWCIASDLMVVLKGNYCIGWENDNSNTGWIPCEIKMPEDCEEYKGKKIIDVLVTTDRGKVTKVQRIFDRTIGWYWGRILGEMRAWRPLPKPYKLNGV